MNVYALFMACGDGDGYTVFKLDSLHHTEEGAIRRASLSGEKPGFTDMVHGGMLAENNFTVVASREDCSDECRYGHFGGYIVEEIKLES